MDSVEMNKIFKHIDKKFDNMTEEELDEYDLDMQIKLTRLTGKQLDSRKKTGYSNHYKNINNLD